MFNIWLGLRYALATGNAGSAGFLVRMAILSLASGTALLVLVLAVMSGFEHELKQRILNLVPHINIGHDAPLTPADVNYLTQLAATRPEVQSVDRVIELKLLLVKGKVTKAVGGVGLAANSHALRQLQQYRTKGNFSTAANSVMLSETLAAFLQLQVGDKLLCLVADDGLLRQQPTVASLHVTGLFRTRTELDQKLVMLPLATAARLAQLGEAVTAVHIMTSDVLAAPKLASELFRASNNQFWMRDWTRSQGNLFHAVQTSRQLILLMLLVIVAVAAMNIVTAMTMVVSNKRQEIAMLMAMGLTPKAALAMVLVQGLWIALVGIILGVVAGSLLAMNITALVQWLETLLNYQFLKSDIYPITYLPAIIRWQDIVSICVPALFITLLSALLPAIGATRVMPAEALRYDK